MPPARTRPGHPAEQRVAVMHAVAHDRLAWLDRPAEPSSEKLIAISAAIMTAGHAIRRTSAAMKSRRSSRRTYLIAKNTIASA